MTGIERYRNDNPRSASEIAAAIETELQAIDGSLPVVEGTQNFAYIRSFARTLSDEQEAALAELYDSGYITDASGEELTKKANEVGVERKDAVAATGVAEFSRDTDATQDRVIPSGTRISTGGNDPVTFETTEQATISTGTKTAKANIQAVETGQRGNVGANTITVLLEQPAGVEDVTNPNPTGDNSKTLTDGSTPLQTGRPEELDEDLRDRALDTVAIGGAGTVGATSLALTNIDEVISADVFTNRSDSTVDNVDPWHTEVRVYGGAIGDIGDALYDTLPLPTLKTLQGGANGTKETTTVDADDIYGTITIEITRPTQVSLDITIDLVHTADYAGTKAAKNAVVNYIGGTKTDSSNTTGLGQGEDVIVNEVENVVEDVNGVEAVTSSLIDEDDNGNDDTTTDSDGVQVLAVANTEVATVDAANITVNETAR